MIRGLTARNILCGSYEVSSDLATDIDENEVKPIMDKIRRLNETNPIGMDYGTFIKKLANSVTDGEYKYRHTLVKLLRFDQKKALEDDDSLISVKGTWCLNHCLKLRADDVRQKSKLADEAVKLIIACRSYIAKSTINSSKLKLICKDLGIKYYKITEEFEDRLTG